MDRVPPLGELAQSELPADRAAAADPAVGSGGEAAQPPRAVPRRAGAPQAADPAGLPVRLPRRRLGGASTNCRARSASRRTGDLVKAWNEPLFAGFAPAETERPRVDAARQRVAAIDRLDGTARAAGGKVTLAGEAALAAAATIACPPDYRHRQPSRVERGLPAGRSRWSNCESPSKAAGRRRP